MVTEDNNSTQEHSINELSEVPKKAIVKPEDERPVKTVKRPEEELPGNENTHDDEGIDDTADMDEDGSPDWDPAIGPGV